MKKHVTTTLGFLIAPLFAATACSVVGAIVTEGDPDRWSMGILVYARIFYFYTFAVTLIIGVPAYLLLNRFDKVTWWSTILAGLLCGALMVSIFDSLNIFVVPIGGLSAFVFWVIWRLDDKSGNMGN